ncbi:MAG TPA: hypothetical protein VK141_00270, partial [Nitrosomonas sp.]|nr:hypothetical protein [Nitrosomonas sp.]
TIWWAVLINYQPNRLFAGAYITVPKANEETSIGWITRPAVENCWTRPITGFRGMRWITWGWCT